MLLWILLVGTFPIGVLLLCLYWFGYSSFQAFNGTGISGPKPSFFYGNYMEWVKDDGILKYLDKLHKQYGPVVGYFRGQAPQVSVVDPELIKQITIKDFNHFVNRQPRPKFVKTKCNNTRGLPHSRDDAWRSMRAILSPTFSAYRLRAMTPIILKSVNDLVKIFGEHADTNKSFEIYKVISAYTLESLLANFFGRVIHIQKGESHELATKAAAVFRSAQEDKKTSVTFFMMLLSNFPWLKPLFGYIISRSTTAQAGNFLIDTAYRIVETRREEGPDATKKYKDFLQLMIDANVEGGDKKRLTDGEVVRNTLTFMMAGYETTASSLCSTTYMLAMNPHVQEKLQAEIDAYLEENPNATTYEVAQDVEYLNMVINEALRFTRECTNDYKYKDITIPKGAELAIPCALIHQMPEYWKNPEKFDPMRFTAEEKAKRPPHWYLPFGSGPRICIGMRFALLEIKLALIEMLKKFTFVRTPDTQVPLEMSFGFTSTPKHGVYLKCVTRGSRS